MIVAVNEHEIVGLIILMIAVDVMNLKAIFQHFFEPLT